VGELPGWEAGLKNPGTSILAAVFFGGLGGALGEVLRTSSATTAKPAPASPARAASTAALRARMLVWKAISSMTLMILAMLSLEDFDLAHGPGHGLHISEVPRFGGARILAVPEIPWRSACSFRRSAWSCS
jgi:hypothetical protein